MDIKYGPQTQQHGGWKKPVGNDKFLSKIISSNYHME